MKLDEEKRSIINDPSVLAEMLDVIYGGSDNRPAWIGGHRPATLLQELKAQAGWACDHYDFYLNFVREHVDKRGRILDIGCGAGQNTSMLARYGDRAIGIDSDPKAITFATKNNKTAGTEFINGSFPEDLDQGGFDYIFCIETIEHVPYEQQIKFLLAALDKLYDGGRMFITTPNEQIAEPPHIGIWSRSWIPTIFHHIEKNIERRAFFDNKYPDGFVEDESSHYAMVLKKVSK